MTMVFPYIYCQVCHRKDAKKAGKRLPASTLCHLFAANKRENSAQRRSFFYPSFMVYSRKNTKEMPTETPPVISKHW